MHPQSLNGNVLNDLQHRMITWPYFDYQSCNRSSADPCGCRGTAKQHEQQTPPTCRLPRASQQVQCHEYTLHSCWEVQSLLYARKLFACAVLPEHRHRSAPPISAAIFRGKGTTDLTEGTAHSTQHLDIQAHLSVPAICGTQFAYFMARHMVGPFLQLRIRE